MPRTRREQHCSGGGSSGSGSSLGRWRGKRTCAVAAGRYVTMERLFGYVNAGWRGKQDVWVADNCAVKGRGLARLGEAAQVAD